MSCPSLAPEAKMQQLDSDLSWAATCFSLPKTRSMYQETVQSKALATRPSLNYLYSKIGPIRQPPAITITSKRGYASKPCPPKPACPCGPCTLPPPCNTPPKCLQYMTGYYYYPYGFWFCGPYHVTGTCTPVGPCTPSSKPNPVPCACTCAKCCACLSSAISPVFGPPSTAAENIKHSFTSCQQKAYRPPANPMPTQTNMQIPSSYRVKIQAPPPPLSAQPAASKDQCTSTRDKPTASKSKTRTGISKFFPFRSGPTSQSGKPHTTCFCPYSTQPQPACSVAKACMLNGLKSKTLQSRQMVTYPKYTRRGFSGSFSKSFSDYYQRKASLRLRSDTAASRSYDDAYSRLTSPRIMLSPEERDSPYVEPNMFDYSHIPNFKNPYPF